MQRSRGNVRRSARSAPLPRTSHASVPYHKQNNRKPAPRLHSHGITPVAAHILTNPQDYHLSDYLGAASTAIANVSDDHLKDHPKTQSVISDIASIMGSIATIAPLIAALF